MRTNSWSLGRLLGNTIPGKITISCQYTQLQVRFREPPPLPESWGFAWLDLVQVFSCSPSLCEFTHANDPIKPCKSCSLHSMWLLLSFPACFPDVPGPGKEKGAIEASIRTEYAAVSQSLHTDRLWGFGLISIYRAKQISSDENGEMRLSMCIRKELRVRKLGSPQGL